MSKGGNGGQYGTNNGGRSIGQSPGMPFQGGGVGSFGGPGMFASSAQAYPGAYNYAMGRLGQMPQWQQGTGGQYGRTGYPPPQLGGPIKPPDGLGGFGGFNGPTDQANPTQVSQPQTGGLDPNESSFTPQMPGPGEGLQAQSQSPATSVAGADGQQRDRVTGALIPSSVPGTSFNPMSGLNGPPPGGYGGANPGMQQSPQVDYSGMTKPMRFDGGNPMPLGYGGPNPGMQQGMQPMRFDGGSFNRFGGNQGQQGYQQSMPLYSGPNPGMQQPMMGSPMRYGSPGGSFGGRGMRPQSFMPPMPVNYAGQNPMPLGSGGPAPQQPPPPPQQTDQQRFDAQNQGLLKKQTVMDPAYFQSAAAPAQPPPQPTGPEQPGQHGNYFGVPNAGGSDFNNQGSWGWQPNFGPGAQNYITQMLRPGGNGLGPGSNGLAPWANQINWGDALNSIGQLSGTPYNAGMFGPR